MIPSLILNACLVLLVAGCLITGLRRVVRSGQRIARQFRFFTTLSNVLCALTAAAVIAAWLVAEALPMWAIILKYVGTSAVTVTMLTVLLFLGPLSGAWKELLSGEELFLHLICPLLALVSFLAFEKQPMPAWTIALGVAPVFLYAALYCRKVIYAPEQRRWEDFYGFNHNGKWPLSYAFMLLGAGIVAFVLWVV